MQQIFCFLHDDRVDQPNFTPHPSPQDTHTPHTHTHHKTIATIQMNTLNF